MWERLWPWSGAEEQHGDADWEAKSLCLLVASRGYTPRARIHLPTQSVFCLMGLALTTASPTTLGPTPAQAGGRLGHPEDPLPGVARGSVRPVFYWFIIWS